VTIRVFLADDHAIVRDGLIALIDSQPDLLVVGDAGDGQEAIAGCRELAPDVAVVDLSMPGGDGIEAIRTIRECCPNTRVLALTMHDDTRYLRAVLAAGGSGYLIKRTASRDLIDAIRQIHDGSSCIRMTLSDHALMEVVSADEPEEKEADEDKPRLSTRERQVLELLAYGYTNKEIAQRLAVATKSVDTYRARLQDKLSLRGRAQLVRYALDHGILKPSQPPEAPSDDA
jgi:DNA-binding NarL/FixJ family response regulator